MKKSLIYTLFVINLLIILYFWWIKASFGSFSDTIMTSGRLSGLLAVFFILMQFMLMGRARWVEELFGLDKLSRVHRLNGYLSISFILLHSILIVTGYAMAAKMNVISQFLAFTSSDDIFQAFLAAILFVLIVFFSVYIVRRKLKYEVWYFIHLFTYLAIFLAWGHQLENGSDFAGDTIFTTYWYILYIFVFGNVLLFRFLRPIYVFLYHGFYVEKVIAENNEVTSIIISGKHMDRFKIKSGQFMVFKFLNRTAWWQSHPFSISWKYTDKIRLSAKNVGDFTSTLSSIKEGTKVVIDGPYGVFTENDATKNKVLMVAGGIGITPIRSLLESMGEHGKDIVLLYQNKTKAEVAFKNELEQLKSKYKIQIFYILSQEQDPDFVYGRLDKDKLQNLVKDVREREAYVCGPPPMIDSIREILIELGIPSSLIHFEKFSL